MISKGVQSDSSDTDTDDDKLGDEYYFQASTSSGSYFAKMMPEDDQLVFLKNTNTNNWQCQAMIENVCTESLVAFYVISYYIYIYIYSWHRVVTLALGT